MSDSIINDYNVYCDESRVENKDSKIMTIGSLFIPRNERKKISNEIDQIFIKNHFNRELKWNKVGKKYLSFYKEIVDYFIQKNSIQFRCIVVNKSKVKYDEYHENDSELAFFKFYYLMLRKRLSDFNNYFIFLDRKPTRDKNRARALKAYLDSYVLLNKTDCSIKHLQSYQSNENKLIQFADFLTGLMGFACNNNQGKDKLNIVNYLESVLERKNICESTPLSETKFNIFVWDSKL